MKKHLFKYMLLLLTLMSYHSMAQQKRTVDFIGGARSVLSNNNIVVSDSLPDTTTIKRNSGGYALIDLGVDFKPNKNTEILGMFRIRNAYGGFWGAGVTFGVRQLFLKGVISDRIRYQVGDLNLKQTPFTLYNHHADRLDSLPSVFKLQNDILNYEKFYRDNTWRQQGANVDFGFQFSKGIKELNFTGYLTRLNATDFSSIPDRLMGGTTIQLIQSKSLAISYNGFSVFDVKGTVLDSNTYTNNVNTIGVKYLYELNKNTIAFNGEAGRSNVQYAEDFENSYLADYFVNASATFNWLKKNLSFTAGYLNVGPDFRSIGAQSKEIDYSRLTGYYNRYSNDQIIRPINLMDLVTGDSLYATSVSSKLNIANPVYNNVMPYGLATFNRIGAYLKLDYHNDKGIQLNAQHFYLSEIRGQGTLKLKQFQLTKLTAQFEMDKLFHFQKRMNIQIGVMNELTSRNSDVAVEKVDLKTMRYQLGAEYELFKKIDVLAGGMFLNSKGNEFIPERNIYTTVSFFNEANFNLTQKIIAVGARCRFDEKIHLTALYQVSEYNDKLVATPKYSINQFTLIYNMTF